MDRTIDVCGYLKRKFKGGDVFFKTIHEAFSTKTNVTSFCPLIPEVYGFFNFKLDFDKFPLQLSSVNYVYTFAGDWYSMVKDKSGRKTVKLNLLNINMSYHFLD